MTTPAILFGIVLSTAYGTAFHVWKGGSLKRLFLYAILSGLGFWTGHFVGRALGWSFAAAGPINTGMATLGSVVFLIVGEWLSRVEISKKKSKSLK
jgi:NO-binding membrane sensor protein with MHYT domain